MLRSPIERNYGKTNIRIKGIQDMVRIFALTIEKEILEMFFIKYHANCISKLVSFHVKSKND